MENNENNLNNEEIKKSENLEQAELETKNEENEKKIENENIINEEIVQEKNEIEKELEPEIQKEEIIADNVDKKENKSKEKKKETPKVKVMKIRSILVLIMLLMFNSFAWFVFTTKVDTSFRATVSSWNIEFDAGDSSASSGDIEINVDQAYPGMDDYVKVISVRNRGEAKAQLEYQIEEFRILDKTYMLSETFTEEDLVKKLDEYPFKLTFDLKNEGLINEGETGEFTIKLVWPFESDRDEDDTFWGEEAYKFANTPNRGISLKLKMKAEQVNKVEQEEKSNLE